MSCHNYHGISLLSCAYKILSRIIFQKLLPFSEKDLDIYRARGRATTDRTRVYNIGTHHLFIDSQRAYDSILREELYQDMLELGIPAKMVRTIRVTKKEVQYSVRIQGNSSEYLETPRGLHQGDCLACLFFNIVVECAERRSGI